MKIGDDRVDHEFLTTPRKRECSGIAKLPDFQWGIDTRTFISVSPLSADNALLLFVINNFMHLEC